MARCKKLQCPKCGSTGPMVLEMFYGPRQPTVEDVGERTGLQANAKQKDR